jgi:hypothetical protein
MTHTPHYVARLTRAATEARALRAAALASGAHPLMAADDAARTAADRHDVVAADVLRRLLSTDGHDTFAAALDALVGAA